MDTSAWNGPASGPDPAVPQYPTVLLSAEILAAREIPAMRTCRNGGSDWPAAPAGGTAGSRWAGASSRAVTVVAPPGYLTGAGAGHGGGIEVGTRRRGTAIVRR